MSHFGRLVRCLASATKRETYSDAFFGLAVPSPQRTIVGLGVTANESRLDARQVIDQINLARRRGFAGAALFDLDTTLEKQILPFLRLGLW